LEKVLCFDTLGKAKYRNPGKVFILDTFRKSKSMVMMQYAEFIPFIHFSRLWDKKLAWNYPAKRFLDGLG